VLLQQRPAVLAARVRIAGRQLRLARQAVVNLLPLEEVERITTVLPVKTFDTGQYVYGNAPRHGEEDAAGDFSRRALPASSPWICAWTMPWSRGADSGEATCCCSRTAAGSSASMKPMCARWVTRRRRCLSADRPRSRTLGCRFDRSRLRAPDQDAAAHARAATHRAHIGFI